jgi:hypothetical protein
LYSIHVDFIQVRAFFAIHFDVDKEVVHQFRDLLIFEGLALHNVTPMAGGVTNAQ